MAEEVKRKFKLVSGDHYDGDKHYVKGDVVESTEDLAAKFPGRFEEVL